MPKKDMNEENISVGLTPKKLKRFIETCVKAGRAPFVWGPPGVGKSEMIKQVALSLGYGLIDFRALMRDVVDLNGIPSDLKGYTAWLRPKMFPEDGAKWVINGGADKGLYFLDELNAAPPLMQAACYQIVHDKHAGEHKMREGWVPIAAGNYDTDGAVTSRMPTPLKSRFVHANIELIQNVKITGTFQLMNQSEWADEWCEWALKSGKINPFVIAFIRSNSDNLYLFDKGGQTFPCQRTWEFVSDVLNTSPDSELLFPLIAGCIGKASAAPFYAYMRQASELPDIESILKDPDKAKIPKEKSMQYAIVTALAARGADAKVFGKVVRYFDRLPVEFSVMGVTDCWNRNMKLKEESEDFVRWAREHGDLIVGD